METNKVKVKPSGDEHKARDWQVKQVTQMLGC